MNNKFYFETSTFTDLQDSLDSTVITLLYRYYRFLSHINNIEIECENISCLLKLLWLFKEKIYLFCLHNNIKSTNKKNCNVFEQNTVNMY